jgi:hypothetical protein
MSESAEDSPPPPIGLRSGGSSLAVARSTGGVAVLEAPFNGGGVAIGGDGSGGGGGGHTADTVSDESRLASLASILGARVPVGRPCGPIRIRAVCLYDGLGGVDSGTGMTSTSLSSLSIMAITTMSSSSSSVTPSPSPSPGDENTGYLCATEIWARAHTVDGARQFPVTPWRVGRI